MGYLKDSIRGLSWMTTFRVLYRLIGVLRISIIAHILSPASLGVFGIVAIVLGFLEIITETGINIFLIQEKDDIDNYIDTAWVVSIFRGFLVSILMIVSAPFISKFFHSKDSLPLLYISSIIPIIRGFINPSIVKFQKELEFNKEFLYRISVFSVDCLISVILVAIYKSPMGIVVGLLTGVIFELTYTFIVARPIPKFSFDKIKINKILNRGKWITLFGISDYLYTQSDNVIVGKMLGTAPLGIYQNAYKISTAPLTEVGDVFFRVAVPVFSKISTDKKRLKKAFIKNSFANVILMSFLGILIYIFAGPIVNIIFGKGWESAIPVVKLLSILGVVRGVASSVNSLFVAKINQKYSAIVTLTSVFGLLITIVPLVRLYGIIGAGVATIIGTVISLPLTIYYVRKTIM